MPISSNILGLPYNGSALNLGIWYN
jgi:hypothetical protein